MEVVAKGKKDVDGVMMSLGLSEIWTFHINVERGR